MIKLIAFFCLKEKDRYLLILKVLKGWVKGRRGERILSRWNQGKTIEITKQGVGKVVLRTLC